MKILILGSGYLGTELACSLSSNHSITCIGHANDSYKFNSKFPNINFIKGDVYDKELLEKNSLNSDQIYYCIWTGSVVDCIENPQIYKKINIDNFSALIESIKPKNSTFFLFSSAFVYSDLPKNSENSETKPETLYGKYRLQQELILKKSHMPYVILRLANIFGHQYFWPKQSQNVIDKFISNVFSTKQISLHGDGTQLVDLVQINQVLNLVNKINEKSIKNEIFNVSNESRTSIIDIAKTIQNYAIEKYNISIHLYKKNDYKKLPNIPAISSSKIMKYFQWKNLETITIKDIFEYENNRKNKL